MRRELSLMRPEDMRRVGRYAQILTALSEYGTLARYHIAEAIGMSVCPQLIQYIVDLERSGYVRSWRSRTRNKLPIWFHQITPQGEQALRVLYEDAVLYIDDEKGGGDDD